LSVILGLSLFSLGLFVPSFASPYALQNPSGTVNATNATSGNTSPTPTNPTSNSGAITVTTDKTSYTLGNSITISGSTQDYITDTPVSVYVYSPIGNLVVVHQVYLNPDRTYSDILTPSGPLWQAAGTYSVKVQFGSADRTAQTTFYFAGSSGQQGQTGNAMQATGTDLSVQYGITNGKLLDITANVQSNSLIFSLQTTGDGILTVTLPRILIDTRLNDQTDGKFQVLNNGQANTNFQETSTTTTDRTLSIPFTSGTTEIEIIGTDLVGRVSGNGPQQQIQTTSGGTLQVGLLIEPLHPSTSSQTQLNINFMNKQTNAVQPSIDYKITVMQGGNQVFVIPVTHTVQGIVTIPIQFHNPGTYQIIVEVDGMVFQPIPPETATFPITISGNSQNQPPPPPTTPLITVSTDKSSYTDGDIIVISGINAGNNAVVTIKFMDDTITTTSTNRGDYSTSVQIPRNTNSGQYVIQVQSLTGTAQTNIGVGVPISVSQPPPPQIPTPTPIPTPPPPLPVNSTTAKIPNWVKGVFGFYADGKLSSNDLIQALQFLIQQGIIHVPTVSVPPTTTTNSTATVPNWVKGIFNFYAQGNLSDDDLVKALQFLVQQGVIRLS